MTCGAETKPIRPTVALPSNMLEGTIRSSDGLDAATISSTAYVWDLLADKIAWEANATSVIGIHRLETVATGAAFNFLIAPEHMERRRAAFDRAAGKDLGNGVPYRVQFRFLPGGLRSETSIWLEDTGRWWADEDGQPVLARGVVRLINEEYREQQRRLYSGDHDELTGQLNRVALTEALGAVIERATSTGQPCTFLIVSANNLPTINETFGFDIGDGVIASVGQTLSRAMRGGDTIGRYSANKFGIILNNCSPAASRIAVDRLIRSVRDATSSRTACPISATLAIGCVQIPKHAKSVETAISNGLQALAAAKNNHHDSLVTYEANPRRESERQRNVRIADEVISALDTNRMRMVLQPIVSSKTGVPAFYEALLRMDKLDGSTISAGEFIEVAEYLGLSRLIDRRTLELAIELLKKDEKLKLSLNVSGLTCTDNDWLQTLLRLSARDKSLTNRLIVEITETAAIDNLDRWIAFVDALKELGCKVAIDDFGAGYTSFKNLKHLAVDMVKIDGAFVKNLASDPGDRIFLQTMVDLADNFGMETVAEWVGCEQTAKIVKGIGITYMQGFHFGRPLELSEVISSNTLPQSS